MSDTQGNAHILSESVCTLQDAPSHVPTKPTAATVWNWQKHGLDGHKLEVFRIGSRRVLTSREAIQRFLDATKYCRRNRSGGAA